MRRGPREEWRAALHEEVDRLPERLRRPLVLCHLEDRTHAQAAVELRLGEATVRRRLAGARELLRSRLARRGIVPAAAAGGGVGLGRLAGVVGGQWPSGRRWRRRFPGGIVTPAASARSRGGGDAVDLHGQDEALCRRGQSGLRTISGLVAASGRPVDDPPKPAPRPEGRGRRPGRAVEVRGRVVGPHEVPIAGAAVTVTLPDEDAAGTSRTRGVASAQAGADGRFRFEVAAPSAEDPAADPGWRRPEVIASAEGYGPDWVALDEAREGEVTLRLAPDDVPLRGRVLDLEGRPVAGARVTMNLISTAKGGDLTPYLKAVRDGTEDGNGRLLARRWFGPLPNRKGAVTTDAEGRFTLDGFGRERLVEMTAEAPSIEHVTFMAMTRAAEAVGGSGEKSIGLGSGRVHGARFDLVVPPGRSITGVVRDKGTRQPFPGMWVKGAKAHTDDRGRFVATGFAKGKRYELMVRAGRGQPYFVTCKIVADPPGLGPIEDDVECVRGIPFTLRLTDKATGKPVVGEVSYSPVYPNRWSRVVTGFEPINGVGSYVHAFREPDGTYSGGVLPGPGAIFVRTAGRQLQGRRRSTRTPSSPASRSARSRWRASTATGGRSWRPTATASASRCRRPSSTRSS